MNNHISIELAPHHHGRLSMSFKDKQLQLLENDNREVWQKIRKVVGTFVTSDQTEEDFEKAFKKIEKLMEQANTIKHVSCLNKKLDGKLKIENNHLSLNGESLDPELELDLLKLMNNKDCCKNLRAELITFTKKLMNNPNLYIRQHLYSILKGQKHFELNKEGKFMAFKAANVMAYGEIICAQNDSGYENGMYRSGNIHLDIGNILETSPEALINPAYITSALHTGNYEYAKHHAVNAVVEVKINPSNVAQINFINEEENLIEFRVCRAVVVEILSIN